MIQILSSVPWPVWFMTFVVVFLGEMAWRMFTNNRLFEIEKRLKADLEEWRKVRGFMLLAEADITDLEDDAAAVFERLAKLEAAPKQPIRQGTRSNG